MLVGVHVVFEVLDSLRLLLHGFKEFLPALNVRFIDSEGPRLTSLFPCHFILVQVLLVLYSLTLLACDDALGYDSWSRPLFIILIGNLEVFLSHRGG